MWTGGCQRGLGRRRDERLGIVIGIRRALQVGPGLAAHRLQDRVEDDLECRVVGPVAVADEGERRGERVIASSGTMAAPKPRATRRLIIPTSSISMAGRISRPAARNHCGTSADWF